AAAMTGITAINIAGVEAAKTVSGQPFESRGILDIGKEIGGAAADAVLTFGVLGVPGPSAGLLRDTYHARKAEQARDFYTALGQSAEASKVRERLPEAYQEHIAEITKDTPVE